MQRCEPVDGVMGHGLNGLRWIWLYERTWSFNFHPGVSSMHEMQPCWALIAAHRSWTDVVQEWGLADQGKTRFVNYDCQTPCVLYVKCDWLQYIGRYSTMPSLWAYATQKLEWCNTAMCRHDKRKRDSLLLKSNGILLLLEVLLQLLWQHDRKQRFLNISFRSIIGAVRAIWIRYTFESDTHRYIRLKVTPHSNACSRRQVV
jgi:hypothetical protein